MARFIEDAEYEGFINVEKIKDIYRRADEGIGIRFTDTKTREIESGCAIDKFVSDVIGETFIKQVIPMEEPLYAVHRDVKAEGRYWIEPLKFIALTADGKLKGVILNCEFIVVEPFVDDCIGFFRKNELAQFNIVGGSVEAED